MAPTVKSHVRGLIRSVRETMKDKTLPKAVHDALEALSKALGKTWTDLEGEAQGDVEEAALFEHEELPLLEGATVGIWCESRIHLMFTQLADDLYGQGYLTRDERIALSTAIGQGLDAFVASVTANAPQLYERSPWTEPAEPAAMMSEAGKVTKREDGKDFPAGDYAYVPDAEKSSTWKLRLTSEPGGDPDPSIVGAAVAAMGKGFRGQKVDIPAGDKPKVMAKVRAAWKKANPDKSMDMMPATIKEAGEDAEYQLDFVPLLERAVRPDGTMPVKIIQPGWGSSGYYSPVVLERAAQSKIFGAGLKMYWNHPTVTEEAERPERDLRDLAAELVSDARWTPDHPSGPGLYAEAKVFDPFTEAVDQLAPHIGVSIRALGKAEAGQAEGKSGPIIKEISSARSVDFVTEPGAGGQILSLFEARRGAAQSNPLAEGGGSTQEGDEIMGEKELLEANAQLRSDLEKLQEKMLLREAGDYAAEKLAKVDLPVISRNRLLRDLVKAAPFQEGKLDVTAFAKAITEAVQAETAYLVEVTGGGKITGMGGAPDVDPKPEELEASLAESFKRIGLSDETAKIAAKGR